MKYLSSRLTLDDAFTLLSPKNEPGGGCRHLRFDASVKHQYFLRSQGDHDGNVVFSRVILLRSLGLLLDRKTCFRVDEIPPEHEVNYVVGPIRRIIVFGTVRVLCGRIQGQRERFVIPVKCEYVARKAK